MKQEIITYLSTIKNTLCDISKFIYDNPEESFHEHKAVRNIKDILIANNFIVKDNFMDIETSFYAEYGSGHPKICYLCEYDEIKGKGHLTGHNLVTAMSLGGALALSKVINKLQGSVIIIGCPGEYFGSSKLTMVKQGVFDDIDVVLLAKPNIFTANINTSPALLPLKVEYISKEPCNALSSSTYSALDACLFTTSGLTHIINKLPQDINLDEIVISAGTSSSILSNSSESKFCISTNCTASSKQAELKISELVNSISSLMNIDSKVSYYEIPIEEFRCNQTLTRIFSHNLKEQGIIDSRGTESMKSGLSLSNVSQIVPCMFHYVSICENQSTQYCSKNFAEATVTPYALDRMIHTAETLAITGLDIVLKEDLLNEIRSDFFSKTTNMKKG
jgi:metal-dependent amidase/aminoacylase/carboxypeptidase family protein